MTTQQMEFPSATSVCQLVAADPKNQSSVDEVVRAVREVGERDGTVDLNRVRVLLAPWVHPPSIGATISGLTTRGVLRRTGYVDNQDRKGRNANKPLPLYAYQRHAPSTHAQTPHTQQRAAGHDPAHRHK